MNVVLTNLSSKKFEESRRRLNSSARAFGIRDIRSYDFEEIKRTPFYTQHRDILDQPTGMGYWLWKPYIVSETLKSVDEGDIVIYCDSGIEIIADLSPLLAICQERQSILLFGNANEISSMWTKRDCFILMECDTEPYWKAPQCDAAFCLFRKSAESTRFVGEWLDYACDRRILTDQPNTCGKKNYPDFMEHRRDQSILSLLAQRWKLDLHRMPTQFGNHYKMHSFRVEGEFNCVNQFAHNEQLSYYSILPYYNSPYFQLLDHHRKRLAQLGTDRAGIKKWIRRRLQKLGRLIRTGRYK